jgi:chromosome segregation ATPase
MSTQLPEPNQAVSSASGSAASQGDRLQAPAHRGPVASDQRPVPVQTKPAQDAQDPPAGEAALGKTVPVNEAIKYRRRAQQAESRLQQVEQRLKDVQAQLEERLAQLATAEAQRDELQHQLEESRLRASAERMLQAAGVADVETAMTLLEKRVSFSDEADPQRLQQTVDQLVQEKPFLSAQPAVLPDKTASPRLARPGVTARLAQAATRATQSGNRRAVAEYLRLRRQSNITV